MGVPSTRLRSVCAVVGMLRCYRGSFFLLRAATYARPVTRITSGFLHLLRNARVRVNGLRILRVALASAFLLHFAGLQRLDLRLIAGLACLRDLVMIINLCRFNGGHRRIIRALAGQDGLYRVFFQREIGIVIRVLRRQFARALRAMRALLATIADRVRPHVFFRHL